MIFGDDLKPAETAAPAEWLERACRGDWWTVGALVPNRYDAFLRVYAPAAEADEWWRSYRALFEVIASIGERHTSSPHSAWFAVWEGHGFKETETRIAWRDLPMGERERRARDAERERLRDGDRRRNAGIGSLLNQIPRFERPGRTYYLLTGPVAAAGKLRYPDSDEWRNPDLFWPDDQRWFVATDVDFWSLYVGGSNGFIAELGGTLSTHAEPIGLDAPLEI
ncbi:MAG: hypothetical protein R2761_31610, partial [Acidimicrobiales bacterium]